MRAPRVALHRLFEETRCGHTAAGPTLAAMLARLALAALLGGATGACKGAEPIEWRIELDDPRLEPTLAAIYAEIRRGSCDAPGELASARAYVRGESRPALVPLLPGPHAFRAEATDDRCRRVAAGCTSRTIAAEGGVIVVTTLVAGDGETVCDACVLGRCMDPDAGGPDSGARDGGGADGGSSDSGAVDAPSVDAGPELACSAGSVCECDGTATCVCPPDTTCTIRCTGGSECRARCAFGSTCTVECVGRPCEVECQGAADCNVDCGSHICECPGSRPSPGTTVSMRCTTAGGCCGDGSGCSMNVPAGDSC